MSIECPQCGNKNPPDSVFCDNCGFKLPTGPTPTPAAPPTPTPTPTAPPPAPAPPAPTAPSAMYSLNFKTGAFDVGEITRTFGRPDFVKYIQESDYKFISRKHFTIFKEDDRFFIQDEGSSNGTKLNGEEIRGIGKKEITDNDKILVADTVELQFNTKK